MGEGCQDFCDHTGSLKRDQEVGTGFPDRATNKGSKAATELWRFHRK